MKRGLLTLAIVAIALLCSSVYAYAPLVQPIPDVWIGDQEDNGPGGVPDINFFRFSNAFNFDKYVKKDPMDEDQSTTNVRWSFLATATGLLRINGIATLDSEADSLQPDLVAKELTSWPNNNEMKTDGRDTSWATFLDLVDSPDGLGPPWVVDPTEATCLDTIITVYASNGSKATSTHVNVKANVIDGIVQLPDVLSGGLIHVISYPDPATDGWTYPLPDGLNVGYSGPDPFYVGTHRTSGGSVGIDGSTTRFVYGVWESPADEIAYVANNVYRIQYTIRTSEPDTNKVPNCRLLTEFVSPGKMVFSGGNRLGKGLFAPDTDGNIYNVYVGPPDLTATGITNLKVKFEVIDFSPDEQGTNWLDNVEVDRFPTPDKTAGTLVKSFSTSPADFSSWFPLTLGSPFGPSTVGSNSTGLFIQTPGPVTGQINYGMWSLGASSSTESFEADRLYRCIYTLQSAEQATIGQVRLINANLVGDWSAKIALVPNQTQSQMPPPGGADYSVWFGTLPQLYVDPTKNKMSYLFDVADGQLAQLGTCYLTKVELYYYAVP
jgi:hypothetical protein